MIDNVWIDPNQGKELAINMLEDVLERIKNNEIKLTSFSDDRNCIQDKKSIRIEYRYNEC